MADEQAKAQAGQPDVNMMSDQELMRLIERHGNKVYDLLVNSGGNIGLMDRVEELMQGGPAMQGGEPQMPAEPGAPATPQAPAAPGAGPGAMAPEGFRELLMAMQQQPSVGQLAAGPMKRG